MCCRLSAGRRRRDGDDVHQCAAWPALLQALSWLGRVGATPAEPLELVLGVSERVAYDHVRRLEAAGLVKRVPMRRGQGSLIVLTRAGALEAGYPASRAPQSITPTTWAHTSACAWVSAWLQVRGRVWHSEREIAEDDFWRFPVHYQDRRGTARVTHRPDLAAQIGSGPVAIEVELQRKTQARLYGILSMYADMTDGDKAPLAGVIYVTGNADVDNIVRRTARPRMAHAASAVLQDARSGHRTDSRGAPARKRARMTDAARDLTATLRRWAPDCRQRSAVVARRATVRYMSQPVSLRLPASTVERLGGQAARVQLAPRTLAQRYVEEGLRMDEHPLVRFVDGPAGRRARLVGTGSDVWEVIATVKDNDGDIAETAEHLHLPLGLVQAAVAYYGAFVDEIDDWINRNEHEATQAHNAWLAGQAALQR